MDLNKTYEGPFSPESEFPPGIENGVNFIPYGDSGVQESGPNRCPRILQIQGQYLENFWRAQTLETLHTPKGHLKATQLPLARIKRIMKGLGGAKMVSAETPAVMAKACEMFILELTMRSWLFADDGKTRTLQASDVVKAIRHDDVFDFLNRIARHFDHDHLTPSGHEVARSMNSTLQVGSSTSANPQNNVKPKCSNR